MLRFVNDSLQDADLVLYMVEPEEQRYDENIIKKLNLLAVPIILLINKSDKAIQEQLLSTQDFWKELLPSAETLFISALQQKNLDELVQLIVKQLPVSPPYFSKDELTDRPTRFFVSELIREKILLLYKKELPYSVEVVIDSYKEDKNITRIEAVLYVERESQKAILLGHKGLSIKELGIQSRQSIEEFLEQRIYLGLSVKVLKDWRNNELQMKRFGYY